MSMNLRCEEMELWQTPTYITRMCYETHDYQEDDWRNIRHKYTLWVRSHTNGVWKDDGELERMRDAVNAHLEELYSYESLNFYMI